MPSLQSKQPQKRPQDKPPLSQRSTKRDYEGELLLFTHFSFERGALAQLPSWILTAAALRHLRLPQKHPHNAARNTLTATARNATRNQQRRVATNCAKPRCLCGAVRNVAGGQVGLPVNNARARCLCC